MKRIHLISQPRNLSTAFMYSWAQRQDTTVVDEPFYAYYLAHTGIDHPGKDQTLQSLPQSAEIVKKDILFAKYQTPVVFFKDMAQHLIDMDLSFLTQLKNIIYIRNPRQVLASFAQVIPNPGINDIGIKNMLEIYNQYKAHCIILDSSQLLKDPSAVWSQICTQLDLDFDSSVLQWPAGPRKEDGVWAPYWYKNVHASTGFTNQKTSQRALPKHLESVNEEAQYYYNILFEKSIKA